MNNRVMQQAILKYGNKHQFTKAVEELSEASAAIARYILNPTTDTKEDMLLELADASIMIDQILIMTDDLNHDVRRHMKLARLQDRMIFEESKSEKDVEE